VLVNGKGNHMNVIQQQIFFGTLFLSNLIGTHFATTEATFWFEAGAASLCLIGFIWHSFKTPT